MNANPSHPTSADPTIEDELSQMRNARRQTLAKAQAERAAAAEAGADAIFEQIPTLDARQTLHILRTSDTPSGGIVILFSPKGLEPDTWDRLMFSITSLWRKVERAREMGTIASLNPAIAELYEAGLGKMAVATAAAMNLDVRLVNRSAWHETIFND